MQLDPIDVSALTTSTLLLVLQFLQILDMANKYVGNFLG